MGEMSTTPAPAPWREGTIEIYDRAVMRLASQREGPVFAYFKRRGVCPFCHEISERGSLDDPGSTELQVEFLQLDVPFSDSSGRLGLLSTLSKG